MMALSFYMYIQMTLVAAFVAVLGSCDRVRNDMDSREACMFGIGQWYWDQNGGHAQNQLPWLGSGMLTYGYEQFVWDGPILDASLAFEKFSSGTQPAPVEVQ